MTKHRVLAAVFVTLGIFAACTFPDVSFGPADATTGGEAGVDGRPPTPVLPPDVDPDAGSLDATVLPDGGGHVGEGGCGSNPCDCDGDHFNNPSGSCGGTDCDDFNAFIKPDADFVQSSWDASQSLWPFPGDWNCDKQVTKLFPYNVPCTSPSNCNAGFAGNPGCGESGTYNTCKYNAGIAGVVLPSCSVDKSEPRVQGCK